ncbi:MAG: peptide chain release factor-like protein [Acidimicrobiales bacterium]
MPRPPGDLEVPGGPVIPAGELKWRYAASGRPGGQHANTSNTRVEVVFDVLASEAISSRQRDLVLARLGPAVRVVASTERSQWQNRRLALERLGDRLADALDIPAERRPTRPSRRQLASQRSDREKAQARRRERRFEAGEDD